MLLICLRRYYKRDLIDLRTRTTTGMRFDLKFFLAYSQKIDSPESFIFFTTKVSTDIFIEPSDLPITK